MGVALKMPMDFTLGLAKGFRNAPKLYGDDTVREADKITGVRSGLKTAGKVRGLMNIRFHFSRWIKLEGQESS